MHTEIKDKNALIIGASKGMGKAVALGLAKEGVNVCLVARNENILIKTKEEIENSTSVKVFHVSGDVSNSSDIDRIFDFAKKHLGSIDILINNTGGPKAGGLLSLSDGDWNNAINMILLSMIKLTSLVVPEMIEKSWGRVISITSTVAKEPSASMILSATTRAGVTAFSKSLSNEVARHGITVNCVCPGGVLTDRLYTLIKDQADSKGVSFDELLKENQKIIPMERYASPDEVADYIVFLCSERGRYITGTSISVDGGLTKGVY